MSELGENTAKSGRYVFSIFSLVASPEIQHREVLLIAVQLIESLAKHSHPDNVNHEVFQVHL